MTFVVGFFFAEVGNLGNLGNLGKMPRLPRLPRFKLCLLLWEKIWPQHSESRHTSSWSSQWALFGLFTAASKKGLFDPAKWTLFSFFFFDFVVIDIMAIMTPRWARSMLSFTITCPQSAHPCLPPHAVPNVLRSVFIFTFWGLNGFILHAQRPGGYAPLGLKLRE